METPIILASTAQLDQIPAVIVPIAIIAIGVIALFDIRGIRTAALHPGRTFEDFATEKPGAGVLVKIIGAGFLGVGSLLLIGISIGIVMSI